MNVSVVIATCGDAEWSELAWSRAYPSANMQDPRPEIVIEHFPALSVSAARNAAAADAAGDALIFLDADDELAPGYVAAMRPLLEPVLAVGPLTGRGGKTITMAHLLSQPYAGRMAVYSEGPTIEFVDPCLGVPAVRYVHADGRETPAAIPNRGGWPRVNECVVGTLVSHRLFDEVGGFREFASIEDYDLWLRCFDAGARLAYVEDAVYRAHVSPAGRNLDQSPYDEIWRDHLVRTQSG